MTTRGVRPASLINRAEVRRLVLALFQKHRPVVGITRVSGQALDQIEAWLRSRIEAEVHRHPSVGRTLKL
jgi:hypothetical protein